MTDIRKHVNNFRTNLDESISDSDTSFDLVDASGLGTIPSGYFIPCTIDNRAGSYEIIHIYSVAGNTVTDCERGMEGTSAQSWALNDLVECRLTAEAIDEKTSAVNSLYATLPGEFHEFTGSLRWYPPKNVVLKKVFVSLGENASGSDSTFNVRINDIAIFTSPVPTVSVGNSTSTPLDIDELVTPSDYVTIDCTNASSINAVIRIDYIPEE